MSTNGLTEAQIEAAATRALDRRDQAAEVIRLTAEVATLTGQLSSATAHVRLGTILEHEAAGTCAECQGDLQSYREAVIKKAFAEVDQKVYLQIGTERGLLPELAFEVN